MGTLGHPSAGGYKSDLNGLPVPFFLLPNQPSDVSFSFGAQSRATAAGFRIPLTCSWQVASAGHGPQIVQGPDDRPSESRQGPDRQETISDPVDVDDVRIVSLHTTHNIVGSPVGTPLDVLSFRIQAKRQPIHLLPQAVEQAVTGPP